MEVPQQSNLREQSKLRVLIGPQEISGYYQNLEVGFLLAGVSARLVTTHPHPFGYSQTRENPFFAKVASKAVLQHRSTKHLPKVFWAFVYLIFSIFLVFWSLPKFNVFIFGWGTSFLPANIDILLYRLFGKKVITVLGHGSEARPPYMSTVPHENYPNSASETRELKYVVKKVWSSVRRNEKFASQVVGMQMTAQFLSRDFVDFYRLGLPTTFNAKEIDTYEDKPSVKGKIVVLHVPSNLAVKGTAQIRETMKVITEKYNMVEYRELSGVAHSEVLKEMKNADIVLDWLWSDIPMAVVGSEAAVMGKPTIISSYGWPQWEEWEQNFGSQFVPPVIRATPKTLTRIVEHSIVNLTKSVEIGLQAQKFVKEIWSSEIVAENYIKVILGTQPENWIIKPEDVNYLWGAGVSQSNVQRMVESLVQKYGPSSLHWEKGVHLYKNFEATQLKDH